MSGTHFCMLKIQVASRSTALRAGIKAILGSDPEMVFGEDITQPEWTNIEWVKESILICLDEDIEWLGGIPAQAKGVVVVGDGQSAIVKIKGLNIRAWGLIPLFTSANEFHAAIQAVAQGLVVLSPDLVWQAADAMLEPSAEKEGGDDLLEALTEREIEVLEQLSRGMQNKQIGLALGIRENTVKFHISSIYSKLGASNRAEAVLKGIRLGLVAL